MISEMWNIAQKSNRALLWWLLGVWYDIYLFSPANAIQTHAAGTLFITLLFWPGYVLVYLWGGVLWSGPKKGKRFSFMWQRTAKSQFSTGNSMDTIFYSSYIL